MEWAACVGLNYRKFLQVGTRKTSQRLQQIGKAESLSSKIKSFHILLSHSTYVQRLENAVWTIFWSIFKNASFFLVVYHPFNRQILHRLNGVHCSSTNYKWGHHNIYVNPQLKRNPSWFIKGDKTTVFHRLFSITRASGLNMHAWCTEEDDAEGGDCLGSTVT